MPSVVYLAPVARRVGLTSVSVGLVHALDRNGFAVGFCKPIAQMTPDRQQPERSSHLVQSVSSLVPPKPLPLQEAEILVRQGREDQLLQEVVERYESAAAAASVVIVEGLTPSGDQSIANRINARAARSLDANVVLVAAPGIYEPDRLREMLEVAAGPYGGVGHEQLLGCILNLVNAPLDQNGALRFDLSADQELRAAEAGVEGHSCPLFDLGHLRLLACIPWERGLLMPRVRDVVRFIGAKLVNSGNLERRISHVAVIGRELAGACEKIQAGALVITPGDRSDVLMAVAMAALNGTHVAALLLTDGTLPNAEIGALCRPGLVTGVPVLSVPHDLLQAVLSIPRMDLEVPLGDIERISLVTTSVAGQLDLGWVRQLLAHVGERRMSPPAFRHLLVERARKANKRIVLPEGDDPRTIEAAVFCHQRGIARCVLLGKPERVATVAASHGVSLPAGLQVIDPESIRARYIKPMVALRRHKQLTSAMAEEELQDPVVVGTMMLALDQVDGLVSGAVHTTANTIRPALQLIRTAPDAGLVSSVFFMCLPEQVLVYGDCAVNPDPDAEQLAHIAIQSANSALAFGITPRVAMLSYSTGGSGAGEEVEKVKQATRIARSLRPDLPIDGPLQYDAATIDTVARTKAPGSEVAGRATVFVFPDLNTGNTTYKAVQRSASVVSIGPMLQGLTKPVNDLSRGALVEDIVYTIALTAIQAARTAEEGKPIADQLPAPSLTASTSAAAP